MKSFSKIQVAGLAIVLAMSTVDEGRAEAASGGAVQNTGPTTRSAPEPKALKIYPAATAGRLKVGRTDWLVASNKPAFLAGKFATMPWFTINDNDGDSKRDMFVRLAPGVDTWFAENPSAEAVYIGYEE